MLSVQGLQNRLNDLRSSLRISEKNFNSLREQLKLSKKEITDFRGAISEVEKLLLQAKI